MKYFKGFIYLCVIKKFSAIALAFIFFFSGLGFHIDLEYCCGKIEKLGLFDHVDVRVDDCCEMDSESDCHDSDHIVKEFEINDFQIVNAEKLITLPSFTIKRNFAAVLGTTKKENPNFYSSHLKIEAPPIILLNQQFLC